MSGSREGLARSVQVRLARHAREIGVDPNLVLTRYAVERFLYRLSCSPHADRFVLKGALMMLVWLGESLRPTSDADLLGYGDLTEETLARILGEVASQEWSPTRCSSSRIRSASSRSVPRMITAAGGRPFKRVSALRA